MNASNGSIINGTHIGESFDGASLAIAVVLSVTGDVVTALSLTLQKFVHNKYAALGKPSNRSSLFWISVIGLLVGEVGNFVAFSFASPTVVSPLGAVSVIANAFFARMLLKEVIHVRGVAGIAIAIIGSIVVVVFAPESIEELPEDVLLNLLSEDPAIVWLTGCGVSIMVLFALARRYANRFMLINLMLCALLGSITVLASTFTSKFLRDFANGDSRLWSTPLPYIFVPIIGVTGALQLVFLNRAMAAFDSTRVVPVYYITFTLTSIFSGGIVFRDFWRFDALSASLFSAGCLLCFAGVFLVAGQHDQTPRIEPRETPVDPIDLRELPVIVLDGRPASPTDTASSATREAQEFPEFAFRLGLPAYAYGRIV